MKRFVFWTGMLNASVGVALQFPALSTWLVPSTSTEMLRLFGVLALLVGLMVIACSRDLKHRGVLVAWEGILRLIGGILMGSYFLKAGGVAVAIGGVGDLVIGFIYLIWLPRCLEVSLTKLLLDSKV